MYFGQSVEATLNVLDHRKSKHSVFEFDDFLGGGMILIFSLIKWQAGNILRKRTVLAMEATANSKYYDVDPSKHCVSMFCHSFGWGGLFLMFCSIQDKHHRMKKEPILTIQRKPLSKPWNILQLSIGM